MNNTAKKNKKKINVIDVVIILLVLALIGTVAYRIYTEITKNSSSKQSNHILTFEADVTYSSILNYLKKGDAVYLTSDGTLLGYLHESDEGAGAVYEVKNSDEENSPDTNVNKKIKIRGTLKLSKDVLKVQNAGYYVINGKNITKGSAIEVYTEKAVLNIVVKNISDSNQK